MGLELDTHKLCVCTGFWVPGFGVPWLVTRHALSLQFGFWVLGHLFRDAQIVRLYSHSMVAGGLLLMS